MPRIHTCSLIVSTVSVVTDHKFLSDSILRFHAQKTGTTLSALRKNPKSLLRKIRRLKGLFSSCWIDIFDIETADLRKKLNARRLRRLSEVILTNHDKEISRIRRLAKKPEKYRDAEHSLAMQLRDFSQTHNLLSSFGPTKPKEFFAGYTGKKSRRQRKKKAT